MKVLSHFRPRFAYILPGTPFRACTRRSTLARNTIRGCLFLSKRGQSISARSVQAGIHCPNFITARKSSTLKRMLRSYDITNRSSMCDVIDEAGRFQSPASNLCAFKQGGLSWSPVALKAWGSSSLPGNVPSLQFFARRSTPSIVAAVFSHGACKKRLIRILSFVLLLSLARAGHTAKLSPGVEEILVTP